MPAAADDGEEGELVDLMNLLNYPGVSPRTMQPLKPPKPFVEMPDDLMQNLIWKGSLAELTAFVILPGMGVARLCKEDEELFESLARRYEGGLDFDLGYYPDFRSLYMAHYASTDLEAALNRLQKIQLAEELSEQLNYGPFIQPYTAFQLQCAFNEKAAWALDQRWPFLGTYYFRCCFDALLITDEMLAEVIDESD